MNCEILETLYIKSNGDVLCNDDAGESVLLGQVDFEDSLWTSERLFASEPYCHLRASLADGRAPWPGVCEKCAFMRQDGSMNDGLAGKVIRKIQLEPSLVCNLACPCCTNPQQLRERPKPHLLPPALLKRLLEGLNQNAYIISEVEYCGQGEPLMHPQFAQLAAITRHFFPRARQRLITNGNFEYRRAVREEFLEEIIVSCDGAYQESYAQYRVRGKLEQALRFMREAKSSEAAQVPVVIWKYILFEFNDSEEEIIAAQHLAQDLGVDTLMFVITHSHLRSFRYLPETIGNLPILYPNVITNLSPIIDNRDVQRPAIYKHRHWPFFSQGLLIVLDEAVVTKGKYLFARGWVLASKQVTSLHFALDGRSLGKARIGLPRPDVSRAFPEYQNATSGFDIYAELLGQVSGKHGLAIKVKLENNRKTVRSFTLQFADCHSCT